MTNTGLGLLRMAMIKYVSSQYGVSEMRRFSFMKAKELDKKFDEGKSVWYLTKLFYKSVLGTPPNTSYDGITFLNFRELGFHFIHMRIWQKIFHLKAQQVDVNLAVSW